MEDINKEVTGCKIKGTVTTKRRDMVGVEDMINKGMDKRPMDNREDILVFSNIHLLVSSRLPFQQCTALQLAHPCLIGSLRLLRMVKSTTTTKELEKPPGKSLMGCLEKAIRNL
jgi:hypothetical protein